MRLIEQAFTQLYPQREFNYSPQLKYSRKFSSYNANIKIYGKQLTLSLSADWRGVDKDIVIGLIQSLMVKVFSRRSTWAKKTTKNMEYYENFLKKLHLVAPRTDSDDELLGAFRKLNDQFFSGTVEEPNLVWGGHTTTKLGHYDFQTDKIVMSSILKDAPQEYFEYVLYHEMLHKKLKFYCVNGRTMHHTPEFKRQEALFPGAARIEKELGKFLSYKKRPRRRTPKKRKKWFRFF